MLQQGAALARAVSGNGRQWRRAYARPQPRAASAMASVWFTSYPAATLGPPGRSVIETLGDARLWDAFRVLGVDGMHTGPLKRSGGVLGRAYTPTVDGNFDRIAVEIDPAFGTEAQYLRLTAAARARKAVVIGDVIPGHTGKGPDFRLAERAYRDYPGLFHMVEIARADWALLPPVQKGRDSANLSPEAVDRLREKGYLVGRLPRTIFHEPGVKESDFSATTTVRGADGKERRWVYLHYFKDGQPTLNWLDPSFAAQRLVLGDALHSLDVLGESMLRLDANGFLGIEPRPDGPAWSEGHPLSVTSNQLIAGLVRKVGGFTFQELNLTLEDIRDMSNGGPDLSYDFVTRPAYHHALVTGDAEFLRLMLRLMRDYAIDPAGLIHALQNHDELTLELVHFWTAHKDEPFTFRGKTVTGGELRDSIRAELHERLLAPAAPYHLKAANGVSCTSASLAAAALGFRDLGALSAEERDRIARAHLLLAMYNAWQPGVFALSGWDLVGALTLPHESVRERMADGDTRWINRGAYDLLGAAPAAKASASGLPVAPALYGPLPAQLQDPKSFASRLKGVLARRKELGIAQAKLEDVPETKAKGLLVLLLRLPDGRRAATALNFGREPVSETVAGTRVALEPLEGRVAALD
ncbi:MAG: maltose alpha-D-glucosyltransferase [Elusimicrobia bacterium]|nr:maltose alpha-D-glucosyltransferase [Elusimicrobiota bacterium]